MREKIKKIQGINHSEFDDVIDMWIQSGKNDLKSIGIVDALNNNPDNLIETAIITYVLSQLDVSNAELYVNSYLMQKDYLRHVTEYITPTSSDETQETTEDIVEA